MDKKNILYFGIFVFLLVIGSFFMVYESNDSFQFTNKLTATVLSVQGDEITVQDDNNVIYTFSFNKMKIDPGSHIIIEYTGLLNRNKQHQSCSILDYTESKLALSDTKIPANWLDNGIFKDFYTLAYNKLNTLSQDEKIAQLFLVRLPEVNEIEKALSYNFAGFTLYEKDFTGKTEKEVKKMISNLQDNSKIPLLIAVDEEGGKVVRVSSNSNLATSKFKSSQELYTIGGFDLIKQDTIDKSKLLKNLGINLNLAPVVDVSTDINAYMYERSFGKDTNLTSDYAKTVIQASKGTGVSYTLKHFPGYGNNTDTHINSSIDDRSYDDILNNDLKPFSAGINAGAEAILVGHNTVTSIDANNPATLSVSVHNILRNNLKFTGIIMTDDIEMGALTSVSDRAVKAILAGNDLIITTDYEDSFNSVKAALNNGVISSDLIDKLAFRVLAWKYYNGLMIEVQK